MKFVKEICIVSEQIINDQRLSLKAKGAYFVIAASPSWSHSIGELLSSTRDGKEAVAAALAELERHGYLHRVQSREGGRFGAMEYALTEV